MATKLIKIISPEEFQKIYRAEKEKEYKLAYALAYGSGLRISEIIGYKRKDGKEIPALTKEQIDLKTHQIKVIGGKGMKDRITITSPLLTENHLNLLPLKIPRRTLQYHFTKHALDVLGKKMSFHTLRHGFGNYQVNILNTPMPMVQQTMGHSRLDTTGLYTKANPKQVIEAMWARMTGE